MFLKKDDPKLIKNRKVSSHHEEGAFVSKVQEYYRHFFYQTIDMVVNCIRNRFQQKEYIEALQTMEILLLKALREEGFGHELQQMPSFITRPN